ncbi:adenylate cyclase [Nitrosomonas sp. Nm51]|uniref:CHASE2 domain-containing protein n=1 Tax=Nitrosomonas sp. Nm51 TaxID=133720 RepID=UPI0008C18D72|nr:adenylate/guanylate cyclase domain-containing protein [Nitrosomonas sp. Nm51]SER02279.1 adenylate cyclase [Nitrosomonas sp. Nm51]
MTKYVRQTFLGIIIGLSGMAFYLSPQGWYLEEKYGLDLLFQLRGAAPAPDDVMIITIDSQSANKLGLALTPPDFWPWPRNLHARLIDRLHRSGARVIVLDLIFRKAGAIPEHDLQLAQAIENAGNVIVVERLFTKEHDLAANPGNPSEFKLIEEKSIPLLKEISAAVLAHTPFPLPDKFPVPINAYWAFKPSIGDSPTIPAVVLHAYAHEVYDHLTALLHKVHPFDTAHFQHYQDQTKDLESAALFLRQLFINHPEIKPKIMSELRHNTTFNIRQKQLIQALVNLYAGQEAYYLNFYGPPGTIKTIPYYQFLQPAAKEQKQSGALLDQVRGKVVFVGLSQLTHAEYEITRDAYDTVFTDSKGVKISGVEIAATAFANLLENRPVRPFPYAGSLGLLFVTGLTLGFVFPLLSSKALIAAGIITAGAYTVFTWLLFKQAGIWLPLIIPLLVLLPGAIFGSVLLNYFTARQERDQLLELFGQFTPDRVVGDLTRRIDASLSKDQLVFGACMFTDIQGYTTLAEKMDVRALRRLIDDYFQVLSRSVRQNNGVVSEKIGDAMLAIWEATSASKTLREEACEAGLTIINNLNRFNREGSHPPLPTRIGIHFGDLLVSRLGAMDNYIYRVIGDLVNTTSRIENANKSLGTHLLVTDEVIDGIDRFLTRPLGSFQLAGRSTPVSLFELIDYRQTASDQQRLLCTMFNAALATYRQQQSNAINQWQKILEIFPEDGPATFYLNICLKSPPEQWQTIHKLTKNP